MVLLRASLEGMNRLAECDVLVRKISPNQMNVVSGTHVQLFSECSVISAPVTLPDGVYTVSFDAHSVTATKQGGIWFVDGKVSRTETK